MEPVSRTASSTLFGEQFDRPIFIVCTPRSDSTLLFETLAQAPGLFTVGGESHGLIERVSDFAPRLRGWTSNRLTPEDAAPEAVELFGGKASAMFRLRQLRSF